MYYDISLDDFDLACTVLKEMYSTYNTMDAKKIDEVFKRLGLEETASKMRSYGVLCYRKKLNDYFVPWHKNLFGPVTIDSVRESIISESLEENEKYKSLLLEKADLEKKLESVERKIGRMTKQDHDIYMKNLEKVAYTLHDIMGGLSIAEQIAGLKATDEKDETDLEVERIIEHPLTDNPLYDYAEARLL